MYNEICRLVKDKQLRTEMGEAARQHAIEHFNVNKRIQAMNDYYCEVVNEQRMLISNKGENYG